MPAHSNISSATANTDRGFGTDNGQEALAFATRRIGGVACRTDFMEQARHLDNLHLLVKIIEAGSLAAAARELDTTRSLVSRRLMALEKAFGARLVYRDARRFAVTPAGERVYKHAVVMCDAADAAFAAADEARTAGAGTLRVGMHEALCMLV